MKHSSIILGLSLASAITANVFASNLASDDASNYSGGWTNGSNGGTGFGIWSFGNSGVAGQFTGNSTGNAGGASGGINTSGTAWGMFANSGGLASVVRPFTGGALSLGQSVVVDFDNGFIDTGATVGLSLQTSGGANRIEFYFVGGDSSYTINNGSALGTGIGFTGDGLRLTFTLTGANSMNLTVGSLNGSNGGTNSVFTGLSLNGGVGTDIERIRFFNANAGSGSNNDAFYNNLQIIPEPSTVVMVGLGLLGAWFIRRRNV
jgi:hypothetical protein